MARTYIDNWEKKNMNANLNGYMLPSTMLKWLPKLASLAVAYNFLETSH